MAEFAPNRPIWLPPVEVSEIEDVEDVDLDVEDVDVDLDVEDVEIEDLDMEDVEEDDWIEVDWIRFWVVSVEHGIRTGYQEQWWRATHEWTADGSMYWVLW